MWTSTCIYMMVSKVYVGGFIFVVVSFSCNYLYFKYNIKCKSANQKHFNVSYYKLAFKYVGTKKNMDETSHLFFTPF